LTLSKQSPTTASAASPGVLAIAKVDDFDPVADGGSGAENPKQAKRAIDGDPETAWTTERYRKLAAFGGLKPGVGLVLDLGASHTLSSVALEVTGAGTALELRVPAEADDSAPMKSQAQWTAVAGVADAAGKVTLDLTGPAPRTRYLLVYLTSLPPVGNGFFRGGITGVEVTGS
ncbi:MAG: serine/threonine protein kinase, partial [Propionicimonas sp.]